MDCQLCGRTVVVEHLVETKPATVLCESCQDHTDGHCHPRCGACKIIAMSGYSLDQIRRLSSEEMMALMWVFEKYAVVWSNPERTCLTVVSQDFSVDAFTLFVDAKGWCRRK